MNRLIGMCERFPLSKGERLNPKIEGDIHIRKITSKCLGQDLKPRPFGASSMYIRNTIPSNRISQKEINIKKMISVTLALIWCWFPKLQLKKSSSWMRTKFDCTINLSSILQRWVRRVTTFQIFIIIVSRWPMPQLAWFLVHGDRALHALTVNLS